MNEEEYIKKLGEYEFVGPWEGVQSYLEGYGESEEITTIEPVKYDTELDKILYGVKHEKV